MEPSLASNLDISHPTHGKQIKKKRRAPKPRPLPLNDQEQAAALDTLREILPSAAVCVKLDSDTDSASETEEASDRLDLPPVPYRLPRIKGTYW